MNANYKLSRSPPRKQAYLLDSARRLSSLDFQKAPWESIKKELRTVDWSDMEKLSKASPTAAHSLFLSKLLPILKFLVPKRKTASKGRSSQARKRNLLWRKMKKVKNQMMTTTSQKR